MYEKKFPCGTEAKAFTLLEKIAEEYIYSKTYAPLVLRLFEVVNVLNPYLEEPDMVMAGHYYWASFNSDERNYEKAKKIIEEILLLWPTSISTIPLRICLSELLRVGGKRYSSQSF